MDGRAAVRQCWMRISLVLQLVRSILVGLRKDKHGDGIDRWGKSLVLLRDIFEGLTRDKLVDGVGIGECYLYCHIPSTQESC